MTIIRDELIEPYFIGKDAYCYTAYEVITPQKKYLAKGSEGKNYEKPIGHYADFGNALLAIMKHKLNEKNGEYSYENLTFKFLRRNGYIQKLFDLKNKITDDILSLE